MGSSGSKGFKLEASFSNNRKKSEVGNLEIWGFNLTTYKHSSSESFLIVIIEILRSTLRKRFEKSGKQYIL